MTTEIDSDRLWSRFILKLNQQHPFFAAVALHAELELCDELYFAHTSGRKLQIARGFLTKHNEDQRFSFLLHQVLHLALQHEQRGINRHKDLWNVAADIVVNDIISDSTDWPVAPDTAWDARYKNQSVEAVYRELLRQEGSSHSASDDPTRQKMIGSGSQADEPREQGDESGASTDCDSADSNPQGTNPPSSDVSIKQTEGDQTSQGDDTSDAESATQTRYQSKSDLSPQQLDDSASQDKGLIENATHWRSALLAAKQMEEKRRDFGAMSNSLILECTLALETQMNWRSLLWQHVCQSQDDYGEYDRRFIHQGLYLEALDTSTLHIAVIIDTSGSIGADELSLFMTELQAISALYPQTRVAIFFADTELYGPYETVGAIDQMPAPIGGGGTDFVVPLQKVDDAFTDYSLIIYFTDGFGAFPKQAPRRPVLWVLVELGIEEEELPFGQSIRLAAK